MKKNLPNVHIEHKMIGLINNFQSNETHITLTPYLSIRHIDTLAADEQEIFAGEEWAKHHHSYNPDGTFKRDIVLHYIRYKTPFDWQYPVFMVLPHFM